MNMGNNKLKGLKRIDRIINEFTAQFGLAATLETDFCYYYNTHRVAYALTVVDESAKYFIPYCKHLNKNVTADIFLISLLHEIGHHFTRFNFSEDEWERVHEEKEHIEKALGRNPKKAAKWNNIYFNLDVERAATEWGLNYMITHEDEVAEFWEELKAAILRFYRKNGLL